VNEKRTDVYFSADVETDGPIPGPFSMLSFALVLAGRFDGRKFERPESFDQHFSVELRPISDQYEDEALRVNRIDRERLCREGQDPEKAMTEAARWVRSIAGAIGRGSIGTSSGFPRKARRSIILDALTSRRHTQ